MMLQRIEEIAREFGLGTSGLVSRRFEQQRRGRDHQSDEIDEIHNRPGILRGDMG